MDSRQIGNSTYNSLQVKLQKQYAKGLFLLTSYTWSKNITDSGSALGAFFSTNARDQYNRKLEKALSANNLPQRLVIAFNYELPVGPGKALARNATGIARKLLEGWQLNGVGNYQSGDPIPVYMNNNLPLFNFCPNQPFIGCAMPNVVAGVPQKMKTSNFDPGRGDRYLNASAFQVPAPYTYGNAPTLLGIRGFAFYNENLALTKRTYFFGEKANFELRLEMFNVFNRHQFGGVTSPVAGPPGGGINANLSDPSSFGTVNGAIGHREGQIAAKINF